MSDLKGKTVVITGANRGIGLALTKVYAEAGAEVIAVCRSSTDELLGLASRVIPGIDVSLDSSIFSLQKALESSSIDILINNAGILRDENLGSIDYNTVREQFEVNTIAPLRVAEALLDSMAAGSKMVFITSRMGSIADNGSGGYYGYRMSKAALNAGVISLAKDVAGRDIAVALLHPGFVQTEMVGMSGDISADDSASRLAQRIAELNSSNSGGFWHSNGETLPW